MTSKESLLAENSQFLADVKNNPERYVEFLNTMAKFHKYSLAQQINLFFHAPASTVAVATAPIWNSTLGWQLEENAPGIEILDSTSTDVEKVYDFRYTDKYKAGTQPESILWSFREDEHKEILDNMFPGEGSLAERMMDSFTAAAERYNALDGISEKISDTELYALSCSYIMLQRLGYNAEDELGMQFMLHDWQDFNAEFMLSQVNSMTGNMLTPIGLIIKNQEKAKEETRSDESNGRQRDELGEGGNSSGESVSGAVGERPEKLLDEREAEPVAGDAAEGDGEKLPDELSGGIQPESGSSGEAADGEKRHTGAASTGDVVPGVRGTAEPGEGDSPGVPAEGDLRDGLTDIDLGSFDFTADMSSAKGKRAVFAINLAAIKLAKELEAAGRPALPNERELLKNYRGFGGIPEVFDEFNKSWENEYDALRDTLTAAEYAAAKGSVLNAHYTSPEVIQGIYKVLEKMGFQGGNILEPAVGSGRFFEEMPQTMKEGSNLFGVELDSLTSRIAALAHPEAEITNQGFEVTKFANNSFDLAISNVPFGDYKMRADLPYRDKGMLLHDYFIAKMVDQVRPGGIVAAITSSGTLDKHNSKSREYIARRAELVGAFRLPYTAFKGAGTEVTTDILFFKKREHELSLDEVRHEKWINSDVNGYIPTNDYYRDIYAKSGKNFTDNVLGNMRQRSGPFGTEWFCDENPDRPLAELLDEAVQTKIPEGIYQESAIPLPVPVQEKAARAGAIGFYYEDGRVVQIKSDGTRDNIDVLAADEKRLISAIHIREAVYDLLENQRKDCTDAVLAEKQHILNRWYDEHVARYGRIQQDSKLKKIFAQDPSYSLLRSLEVYDNKIFLKKADIFTKRTIKPDIAPQHADTAEDALKISLNERGDVDLEYMAGLTGSSEQDVINDLEFTSIYYNPAADKYQLADEYLSGNIRQKIEEVEQVIADLSERKQKAVAEKIFPGWDRYEFTPANEIEAHIYSAIQNRVKEYNVDKDCKMYLHKHYDNRDLMLMAYAAQLISIPLEYDKDPLFPLQAIKLGRPMEQRYRAWDMSSYYHELLLRLKIPEFVQFNIRECMFDNPDHPDAWKNPEYMAPVYNFLLKKGSELDVEEYQSKMRGLSYQEQKSFFDKEAADFPAFLEAYQQKAAELVEADEVCRQLQQKIDRLQRNRQALEAAKPEDLQSGEISVNLGATWLNPSTIREFLFETLNIPSYQSNITVEFSHVTGEWKINNKNVLEDNPLVNTTYGTSGSSANGKNALELCELALNLREAKIYDTVYVDGRERKKLNEKATLEARIKQQDLKDAFKKWLFADEKRSEKITEYYNRHFNSIKPREYNGEYLTFPGMTADITLKKHQKDAVAHTLYGGNTLLAHCVGAGKTFEMIASAMESKRLGLASKSLIVVPKHLTEQMGEDFQRLYPGAKVLVATDKTFTAKNREEFCSKIATQNWDAVIMGYTQFEKIPLSLERQKIILQEQINEIIEGMEEYADEYGKNNFTVKQMIRAQKKLESKLMSMNKQEKKDQTVVFEDLGIDRLYVDEAHYFKNLYTPTKLSNVAGIQTTEADKTMDFYQKCKYINEITNCRGLVFATGTPVSNSMTELYTMQRYLQPETLKESGLGFFDAWAANFGQQETDMEINPEGQGFRERTKFARFQNLPELMAMFKEIADIKTSDMLDLPVPEENIIVERMKPTPLQKEMVNMLAERAKAVRDKLVDSSVDNMLKITNEGRLLALDQRIMQLDAPDNPDSKVNKCVSNVLELYRETSEDKATQLIFCDKSTPNKAGNFNVYDDIKSKLIANGVPAEEIAFIHDAKTDAQKDALFDKVRKGEVRILLGSTDKMGVGTNVQDRLIATHDLDVPWRPSDLEQRKGRIVRRGNTNASVKIFRYITEGTFDSYMWQILENKQRFISQIMTSKVPTRTSEDCDEVTLSYAEVKACATGNPLIKEKMEVDNQVKRLEIDKSNYLTAQDKLKRKCQMEYPLQIKSLEANIEKLQDMKRQAEANTIKMESGEILFSLELNGKTYIDKKEAGQALMKAAKGDLTKVKGHYRGLALTMRNELRTGLTNIVLSYKGQQECNLSGVDTYNITRMDAAIEQIYSNIKNQTKRLDQLKHDFELAKQELQKPFEKEELLREVTARQKELELKIQSAMDEDSAIKQEGYVRLGNVIALFDNEGEFCPDRLPEEDLLMRAFWFKAAMLYQEHDNQWDQEFDFEIYKELVEKFGITESRSGEHGYDAFDVVDVIIKNSPSVPSYEDLGMIMEQYHNSEQTAAREEYQDSCAGMAIAR